MEFNLLILFSKWLVFLPGLVFFYHHLYSSLKPKAGLHTESSFSSLFLVDPLACFRAVKHISLPHGLSEVGDSEAGRSRMASSAVNEKALALFYEKTKLGRSLENLPDPALEPDL